MSQFTTEELEKHLQGCSAAMLAAAEKWLKEHGLERHGAAIAAMSAYGLAQSLKRATHEYLAKQN